MGPPWGRAGRALASCVCSLRATCPSAFLPLAPRSLRSAQAAQTFFESLNVTFLDSDPSLRGKSQPGHGLLHARLRRERRLNRVQEATLSGVSVSSEQRKAFYDACAQINAGWCPQVNVTASWEDLQGERTRFECWLAIPSPASRARCAESHALRSPPTLGRRPYLPHVDGTLVQ